MRSMSIDGLDVPYIRPAWGCHKDAWSSGSRGFIKVWRGSKILQEAEYACTNVSDFWKNSYISKITYTKKKHFKILVKSLVLSIILVLEID